MSNLDRTTLEQRLRREKAIDEQMDDLILDAQELVRTYLTDQRAERPRLAAAKLKGSQLRNVISVADSTESVELVKNFIRYQIGRDTRKETWGYNGFGLQLVRRLEGPVKGWAEEVADRARDGNVKAAHIVLVRRYLGYLNRYFEYLKKEA